MFRSCRQCLFYVKDREAAMRCMGKVVYRCTANDNARIDKPFRSGVFCKKFAVKGERY